MAATPGPARRTKPARTGEAHEAGQAQEGLPWPVESLNLGRPGSGVEEDVLFVEDWLSVSGAKEARCDGRDSLKPEDFYAQKPGEDLRRLVSVPGSHAGGKALAKAVRDHLSRFFRVVVSDPRWSTARKHEDVRTLAMAGFFMRMGLESVIAALELANQPQLSAREQEWLKQAVREAAEVVTKLQDSELFKAWAASLSSGRSLGGQATAKKIQRKARTRDKEIRRLWDNYERRGHPAPRFRAAVIAKDMGLHERTVRRQMAKMGLAKKK